ncbi:MAG: hypothetical protein ACE5H4_15550, partial [Candidatus Thorarchaeota archaeon]
MLGVEELKETIELTNETVECPVKGCSKRVKRQRRGDRFDEDRFKCQTHNIFISPSTFQYPSVEDNLLWRDKQGQGLLDRIKTKKRLWYPWMARERSEDAVSWNVFRFLEKNDLVEGFLESITNSSLSSSEVIYWSYSQSEDAGWPPLNKARKEFGEWISQSSEPDITIITDIALFFVEVKLTSDGKNPPRKSKKYETGGDNWFSEVFQSDYETVAKAEGQLMRFWLLGSWMAKEMDLDFYLMNLVLSERDANIEAIFGRHIKENQRRRFLRATWEAIYEYISKTGPS